MIPKDCKRLAEVDFPIAEGIEARGAGEDDLPRDSEHAAGGGGGREGEEGGIGGGEPQPGHYGRRTP